MFKKTVIVALMMTLGLSALQPKKAEAGAVLFAAGLTAAIAGGMNGNGVAGPVGGTLAFVGLSGVVVGAVNFINGISFLSQDWAIALIVLDANGNVKKDAMTEYFAKRYPFVDNIESLSELSGMIATKGATQKPNAAGQVLVSLSKSEVQSALSSADISQAQADLIAEELK